MAMPLKPASAAIIPREMPRKINGRCGIQFMLRIVRYCVRAVDALCADLIRDYSYHMPVADDFLQYVLEQLAGLGSVTPRRMFGGVGLYHDAKFFAFIAGDTLYFKVNDSSRGAYEAQGMDRFRPYPDKPELSMTYYAVP